MSWVEIEISKTLNWHSSVFQRLATASRKKVARAVRVGAQGMCVCVCPCCVCVSACKCVCVRVVYACSDVSCV